MTRTQTPLPSWLRSLLIVTIILGIVFRFAHLDRKVFWFDEVINSLHSSGYLKVELLRQAKQWSGELISLADLKTYQYASDRRNTADVIRVLAKGEPQSPPLYYILAHWWERCFGNSVAVKRSLSAVISVLIFPIAYRVCLELFESSMTAWILVALMAISPFHVIFAQEVRLYGLWTVAILLSSWAFLRSMRLNTFLSWSLYSATSTLAFYTFPLSMLTTAAHGFFLVLYEWDRGLTRLAQRHDAIELGQENAPPLSVNNQSDREIRITKSLRGYIAAISASLILFSPWLFSMTQINSIKMSNWRTEPLAFTTLLKTWLVHPVQIFFDIYPDYRDLGDGFESLNVYNNPIAIAIGFSLWALILYSFYFVIFRTSNKIRLFILPLVLIPVLTFILPDLFLGGRRSAVSQYLIPCYIGIHLSLSCSIAHQLSNLKTSKLTRSLWTVILILVLALGVLSNKIISQEQYWWNKRFNYHNIPVAKIINQSKSPVLAGDIDWWSRYNIVSLSYLLKSETKVLFLNDKTPDFSKIKAELERQRSIFILSPNPVWEKALSQNYGDRFKLVYPYGNFNLWQIDP
jgi:uncharacterized membrane protein